MKARVFVTLKSTVLDPQGQTVRSALNGLGPLRHRRGAPGQVLRNRARRRRHRASRRSSEIETIAHEVLANPVIEEYRVEILD